MIYSNSGSTLKALRGREAFKSLFNAFWPISQSNSNKEEGAFVAAAAMTEIVAAKNAPCVHHQEPQTTLLLWGGGKI